ncbi:MAG: hypothetical protein ACE5QV_05725, partial [Fidelibacterota bacterium]
MTKKLFVLVLALAFLFTGLVYGGVKNDEDVVKIDKANKAKTTKPVLSKKGYLYPGGVVDWNGKSATSAQLPHGWLFNYDDPGAEYYLSGGTAGDWFGIWFQSPAAACSLYAFEGTWYSAIGGGTINLHTYPAGTVWPDTVPHGDSIPPGDVFGDDWMPGGFPWQVTATSGMERFEYYPWGYQIFPGRDLFWVAWEKTADEPMLLADDGNPGDYLHTWSYEPNQDGDWAWSHYGYSVGIEALVRVEVVFTEDPPPQVFGDQLPDTYNDATPYNVTARATDNALDPALQGVESATVEYSIDGGTTWISVTATVTTEDDSLFEISADIPAQAIGTTVYYKIAAVDKNGSTGYSVPFNFVVTEPENATAKILVVDDGGVESVYLSSLYSIGFDTAEIEFWHTGAHNGIDKSVTMWGWNTIVVFGWGAATVPTRDYTDNPYAEFLMTDRGSYTNNLLLSDQDHFWTNGEPDEPVFAAGDFDFDFLGLAGGKNDPAEDADSVYTGVSGDLLTDPFSAAGSEFELRFDLLGWSNWVDYTQAGNATAIFSAESGNESGVRYTANAGGSDFNTVFLPFPLEAAVDTAGGELIPTDQLDTLMARIMDWFEPAYVVGVKERYTPVVPVEFTLNQNYPNPFNPG